MTPKEFKIKLEELLSQAADCPLSHQDRVTMIGVLDYACFAFKLGYAQSVAEENTKKAEGGAKEFD